MNDLDFILLKQKKKCKIRRVSEFPCLYYNSNQTRRNHSVLKPHLHKLSFKMSLTSLILFLKALFTSELLRQEQAKLNEARKISVVNVNPTNIRPHSDTPEIRKYKKRFNSEILCAALWGMLVLFFFFFFK